MNNKINATVQSPARDHHLRKGYGFSLDEIKEAGLKVEEAKQLGINIDYRRRTSYDINIEKLKELEPPEEEKRKKRKPFVKKEKKKERFVPQEMVEEKEVKKTKKPTIEEKVPEMEEGEGIALTELQGLGPKTEEKFHELGVMNVQDLLKEDPEELSTLIHGCSETSISDWQVEGREKLKKKK
jgi:ribosomal protein L13E